jgi:hypothetical protein
MQGRSLSSHRPASIAITLVGRSTKRGSMDFPISRDGRKVIPLAYQGRSRFHTSAAANIADLIRVALDHSQNRILNIADPTALTVAEIGATIAKRLGYEGMLLPVDIGDEVGNAPIGNTPWSIPAPFMLNTDAAAALGYTATTYEDSVSTTCDWLAAQNGHNWKAQFPVLASYSRNHFDYAAEDRFLRAPAGRAHREPPDGH